MPNMIAMAVPGAGGKFERMQLDRVSFVPLLGGLE